MIDLEPFIDAIAEAVTERIGERAAPAPYLTVEQAAEHLACDNKRRIYELVSQGRLKHYRDGRRVLLRREDLDAALEVRDVAA